MLTVEKILADYVGKIMIMVAILPEQTKNELH